MSVTDSLWICSLNPVKPHTCWYCVIFV